METAVRPILASSFNMGEGWVGRNKWGHENALHDSSWFVKTQETCFGNTRTAGKLGSRLSAYHAELEFWHLSFAMKNTWPGRWQERVSMNSKGSTTPGSSIQRAQRFTSYLQLVQYQQSSACVASLGPPALCWLTGMWTHWDHALCHCDFWWCIIQVTISQEEVVCVWSGVGVGAVTKLTLGDQKSLVGKAWPGVGKWWLFSRAGACCRLEWDSLCHSFINSVLVAIRSHAVVKHQILPVALYLWSCWGNLTLLLLYSFNITVFIVNRLHLFYVLEISVVS